MAFAGSFRRLAGRWFLEIEPTYRFTTDGFAKYRFHEQQLSGIKRLEGNRAVLSQVLLWADVLRGRQTLFNLDKSLLGFGVPLAFPLDRGIPDSEWSLPTPADENMPEDDQLELWPDEVHA